MSYTPLNQSHDLSRNEIIARYRQRVELRERTKLTRDDLGQLALHFVERVKQLSSEEEIRNLCRAEITLLEEGYPQSSIGSQYLPVYRRLVGQAIADGALPLTEANSHRINWTKHSTGEQGQSQEHYALAYLKYDRGTYAKLRSTTTGANNQRQDNLQPVNLLLYLAKAQELLHSDEPEELAIAIAALTGRRHTEVVARGKFERTAYAYTLHFEGQQKDPDTPPFDILTLLPASEVLSAVERFRAMPEIAALVGLGHDAVEIDAFNSRVNRRVEKHFGSIVPVLEGFKTVSVHRLRGIYGAIAIHYFCPEHKNEHRFLQHYLGHLLDEQGKTLPNAAATQHYFHYRLLGEQGKILSVRGIKVMANGLPPTPQQPQPQLIEPETTSEAASMTPAATPFEGVKLAPPKSKSRKRGSLRIERTEHDRWVAVLNTICPECPNQPGKMTQLLKWVESHLERTQSPLPGNGVTADPTPAEVPAQPIEAMSEPVASVTPAISQAFTDQARTLVWLTTEVERLRQQVAELRIERDQAVAQQPEVEQLKAENSRLAHELTQAQAKLDGFRKLLNSDGQTQAVTPSQQQLTPTDREPVQESSDRALRPEAATAIAINSKTLAVSAKTKAEAALKPAKPGGAKERAMRIFLALQGWNRQHPDNTFALTPGLLEREFGIHRQAAKEFLAENQNLIWEHHQAIQVENERSHNRGKDIGFLKAFVDQQQG